MECKEEADQEEEESSEVVMRETQDGSVWSGSGGGRSSGKGLNRPLHMQADHVRWGAVSEVCILAFAGYVLCGCSNFADLAYQKYLEYCVELVFGNSQHIQITDA